MSLSDPVTVLKGVGASRAAQLERLNIRTLEELIHSYPRDYEDRSKLVSLSQLTVAQPACFRAMVVTTPRTSYVRKGLTYTKCTISARRDPVPHGKPHPGDYARRGAEGRSCRGRHRTERLPQPDQ